MKRDKVNNAIGTTVMYGRARRIEFVERAAYVIMAIISVIIVFVIVTKRSTYISERNVNFSYLRDYMEARGYRCELIYHSGGTCVLSSENGISSFIRNDDGFEFIVKSDGYLLDIKHSLDKGDYITFKTTAYSLAGYRNRSYTCKTEKNVLGELDSCVDANKEKLDSNAYVGVIEKAIYDLNGFIDNSGYKRDKLMNDHEWVKK